MSRIVIVSFGRPCGPCCGRRRFMLLRQASVLIAVFEFFVGCAILSGSIGSFIATVWNESELIKFYTEDEFDSLCVSHAWHAFCSIIVIASSVLLVLAYFQRDRNLGYTYIFGIITAHVFHLAGLYFSFFLAPVYDAIIVLTFVRAYFIWIVYCLYLEIKMYPEGFPPPEKAYIEPEFELPERKLTEASTLRILGDG